MSSIARQLVHEWERTALGTVSVVFVCCLLAWSLPRPGDRGTRSEPRFRPRPSALDGNACAFLDPTRQTPPDGEAFAFAYEAPAQAKQPPEEGTPPEDPEQEKDETRKADKAGGGVSAGTRSDPQAPPPAAPPRTCSIRYLGTYESTTGQRLAALVLRDSSTGKAQTRFLREGEACEGVRIGDFDARALRILVPGGKEATVDRGEQHTVTRD